MTVETAPMATETQATRGIRGATQARIGCTSTCQLSGCCGKSSGEWLIFLRAILYSFLKIP